MRSQPKLDQLINDIDTLVDWQMTDSPGARVQNANLSHRPLAGRRGPFPGVPTGTLILDLGEISAPYTLADLQEMLDREWGARL